MLQLPEHLRGPPLDVGRLTATLWLRQSKSTKQRVFKSVSFQFRDKDVVCVHSKSHAEVPVDHLSSSLSSFGLLGLELKSKKDGCWVNIVQVCG